MAIHGEDMVVHLYYGTKASAPVTEARGWWHPLISQGVSAWILNSTSSSDLEQATYLLFPALRRDIYFPLGSK